MGIGQLDHFNIRTRKFTETVRFYEDVLGLKSGPRPDFSFPGAWLNSDDRPVIHLVDITSTDEQQRVDSGVIDHVAFVSRGFLEMKDRLRRNNVRFRTNEVPGGEIWQIFVSDPNGVVIELNYANLNQQP